MAKNRKADVGSLTPEQMKVLEARLALQERAMEMAQAQVEREQATRQRAAQFSAFDELAKLYASRAGEVGRQFDVYGEKVEGQRRSALEQLAKAAEAGRGGISSAQEQLMRDLVAPTAFQDVPLVELGQVQNPLLAGLQAEGASIGGVQAQSEQDRQIAAQLAALTKGAMGQLNVGEQNYLNAIRNAGAYSAAQARQQLAAMEAMGRQSLTEEYDKLVQQIAQQRLEDVGAYETQAAQARAQQQEFAPIDESDYAARLEAARKTALESIRAALPTATFTPTSNTGTTNTTSTTPTVGRITGSAPISIPYQQQGLKLTPAQLKRKREQEDLAALRARGL